MSLDRYGPQYAGDNSFTARMRFHQSWWRAEVLGMPFGTGPRSTSTTPYGNMLEATAAERGANFLTPAIHRVALDRMNQGGGVERFRCTRNLLSSQPMCFNLFGPLISMISTDSALATRLVAALWPDADECVAVERVVIELAPSPKGDFLDDRTAFDACIEHRRADGSLGFLAIETKLTEPFSQNTDNAPKYLDITARFPDVWDPRRAHELPDVRWFQLWRDHLLARTYAAHPGLPHTSGLLAVVHHPLDAACTRTVADYRTLVTDADHQVVARTLDTIVARWRPLVAGTDHAPWLDAFALRYLDLAASEGAWRTAGSR